MWMNEPSVAGVMPVIYFGYSTLLSSFEGKLDDVIT
jgi:hypothetical protein